MMTAEAKQNGRMTNQAVKSSTSTWRAIQGPEPSPADRARRRISRIVRR